MKQIVELTYWHHPVNKYGSISECVNAWLAAHPKAKLVGRVHLESDPTFFKGMMHKAIFTVTTKTDIPDDFDCFERDPVADKAWDEQEQRLDEARAVADFQRKHAWYARLAAWIAR